MRHFTLNHLVISPCLALGAVSINWCKSFTAEINQLVNLSAWHYRMQCTTYKSLYKHSSFNATTQFALIYTGSVRLIQVSQRRTWGLSTAGGVGTWQLGCDLRVRVTHWKAMYDTRRSLHSTLNRRHHNTTLRADSRLAPSQWETVTSLQSNAVSHWLSANLVRISHDTECSSNRAWGALVHIDGLAKEAGNLRTGVSIVHCPIQSESWQWYWRWTR